MRLVSVAVPVPMLEALTYEMPADVAVPPVGSRVLVPVGSRIMTGCVLGPANGAGPTSTDAARIKQVVDVLDDGAFLPGDVIVLASWVADYYACGVGEAVAAAMPPRAWVESERHARITDLGRTRIDDERGLRRSLLEKLQGGAPMRVSTLGAAGRGVHGALATLERDGFIELTQPLKGQASAYRTVRLVSLTAQGHDIADGDQLPVASESQPAGTVDKGPALRLGERQHAALDHLRGAPDGIEASELRREGIGAQTLTRLGALGLISFSRKRVERDPFDAAGARAVAGEPVVLTDEQSGALHRLTMLAEKGTFNPALLHGVTGSGKTEIYLRLAEHVREKGRGVLLLVPEIALTPAVAMTFRRAFGDRVAIQHSALSDGERHDQWQRIRRGDVDVVVGTRSAVFAPLRAPGLIIVDEEHDGSYKQEESPRYNGRDVAVMRGRHAGALVVLGSATPSLESYYNALNGRYELVTLERRVLDRPLADVRVVDMREEYAAAGPDVILSSALCESLTARLAAGEQAIVLLNRRGFATSVICRQCGSTLECPNCSLSLTVHRAARRARCHYCNYAIPVPNVCVNCAGEYLEQVGFGTERVEAEIRAKFPDARVDRVDRDTIRRRGAITALLGKFSAGELDILVGTQMLAKGHDFPNVTLVGVISADVGLGLADFRAGERTFQLLTQVAGRAGRGQMPGEAIVQTLFPDHYSIQHACRQDYRAFYQAEIKFREAMRYPPVIGLINAIVRSSTFGAAMQDASEIVRALRSGKQPFRVLGPAPAPLSRLKGEHRVQFFLKGTNRGVMRRILQAALAARPEIARRTTVDVDPVSVL
jgi:primosomal protein N' (replication factor Y) (superfamily II helicase)